MMVLLSSHRTALCELRGVGADPAVSSAVHASSLCTHMSFLRELPALPPKAYICRLACTTAVEYPRAEGIAPSPAT